VLNRLAGGTPSVPVGPSPESQTSSARGGKRARVSRLRKTLEGRGRADREASCNQSPIGMDLGQSMTFAFRLRLVGGVAVVLPAKTGHLS
jgi:hypothetical protein